MDPPGREGRLSPACDQIPERCVRSGDELRGDFDLAENLAQEAFIRGFYRLHTLQDLSRFGTWLRSITVNLCRMEIRRRDLLPVDREVEPDSFPARRPLPDAELESKQENRFLTSILQNLPAGERQAILLYYLDGRSIRNVSHFLGVSPGAVKARLHRARKKLRKEVVEMAPEKFKEKELAPHFADKVDIESFPEWALLNDREMQETLREIETMDLAMALKADSPETRKVEERVMANISERVQGIIRNTASQLPAWDEKIAKAQEKILRTVRRFQTLRRIRPDRGRPARRILDSNEQRNA